MCLKLKFISLFILTVVGYHSAHAVTDNPETPLTVAPDSLPLHPSSPQLPTPDIAPAPPTASYRPISIDAPSIYSQPAATLEVSPLMMAAIRSGVQQPFTPGVVTPIAWQGGAVVAAGSVNSLQGMMAVESGRIGITQQFGPLSLYAGGVANKYGFYRGLHTQYGLEASAAYQLTPQLALIASGSYYANPSIPLMGPGVPMPPSMMGYYGSTQFRLTADYQINSWLGVEAGGRMDRALGTGRYMATPVVTPYVSFGDGPNKVKLGIPVGEIVYHMLRSKFNVNPQTQSSFHTFPTGPMGPR